LTESSSVSAERTFGFLRKWLQGDVATFEIMTCIMIEKVNIILRVWRWPCCKLSDLSCCNYKCQNQTVYRHQTVNSGTHTRGHPSS